jgi:hypothetical protein
MIRRLSFEFSFRRKASFEPGARVRKGSKKDSQKSEDTGAPHGRPFSLQPKLAPYLVRRGAVMQQKFAIKSRRMKSLRPAVSGAESCRS